ncbi:MAG: YbaN family protein [Meiothermus sp.]|uniref:YbaN family protein n=1 Tax=Meiothermus sp. TaxID=1955249 RepID=UPI0025DB5901|nr:YbaN family protein [Meiothermus sp.]MCS7068225.1 YbaN family protein [Meiothermus sp.]MCX7601520.1 YbaN family protein [Meiothermus sp.]
MKSPISPLRPLWLSLGFFFAGLGFVGTVVPGMPSTVFFILAAYFFSRSSQRFLNWVLNLPKVGPLVRDYRSGLGMPRKAKIFALCMLSFFALTSAIFLIPVFWVKVLVLLLGLVGFWFIHSRIPTKEIVLAQRQVSEAQ